MIGLEIIEMLEYFSHDGDKAEVSGNENNVMDIGNEKDSEGSGCEGQIELDKGVSVKVKNLS